MVKPACFDKNGMKKGAWSEEEDNKLRAYVERYGHWNWRLLPKYAGLTRCGKSCRLRWVNYLRPGVRRGNFSRSEKELIIKLHQQHGNKWSAMAEMLPGRTDNDIKNYWNAHIKKNMNGTSIQERSSTQISDPDSFIQNPQTSGSSTIDHATFDNISYENEMSFWDDPFLADVVNDENEYFLPTLPAEGESFQHQIHDYTKELSSPISHFSTSEWIADGNHSIIYPDSVVPQTSLVQESFWNAHFGEQEEERSYDEFDYHMSLF